VLPAGQIANMQDAVTQLLTNMSCVMTGTATMVTIAVPIATP